MAEKKNPGANGQREGGGQRQGAGTGNKGAGSGKKTVEHHSKDKYKDPQR